VVNVSNTHALVIYDKACYKLKLSNGSFQKCRKTANWTSHQTGVEYNGNVISVVKGDGIYEINSYDGSWKTLKKFQKGTWTDSLAMCRIGGTAYVARGNGIYRFELP